MSENVNAQTLREKINSRIEELSVTAKKSLGQNFLVDQTIVDNIVGFVKHNSTLKWIEIGPGLGSLTDELKDELKLVIELDSYFAKYWQDQGLNVIEVDALKYDWSQISENVTNSSSTIQSEQAESNRPAEHFQGNEEDKFGLVSNLPYQISSRIVIETSINSKFEKMVLMFQKEVADRILSQKSDSNYGFLSVVAQNFWDIKKLVFVSPNCFNPKPKVDSQVLTFSRKHSDITNRDGFVQFVKNCFLERRKKISNKAKKLGLLQEFKDFFESKSLNVDPDMSAGKKSKNKSLNLDMRAEELSPNDFKELFLFCESKKRL